MGLEGIVGDPGRLETDIRGERGAIMPSEVSTRCFPIKGRNPTIDLNSDGCEDVVMVRLGILESPDCSKMKMDISIKSYCNHSCNLRELGSSLSPALRLRNRKSGTIHTHNMKNVAISGNPGTLGPGVPRYMCD